MHLIGSAKYWSQDSVFAGFPTAGDAHLSFNFLDVDSIQFLTWADPGFFTEFGVGMCMAGRSCDFVEL